jgi:hypothetical protein
VQEEMTLLKNVFFKRILFCFAFFIVVLPFIFADGDKNIGMMRRQEISATILSFREIQKKIEHALLDEEISPDEMEWLSRKTGSIIGKKGEYITINENIGLVIIIKPNLKYKIWNCYVFPEMPSICDNFPINIGEAPRLSNKVNVQDYFSPLSFSVSIILIYFSSLFFVCFCVFKFVNHHCLRKWPRKN